MANFLTEKEVKLRSMGTAGRNWRQEIELLKKAALHLLFPPLCSGCGVPFSPEGEKLLCSRCLDQVEFLNSPLCPICGAGLSKDGGEEDRCCRTCLQRRPLFDSARSLVYYKDPARTLLRGLKFRADPRAVSGLRTIISESNHSYAQKEYDLIVPVPMYPARLKKRGLNQALVLARLLFPGKSVKIDSTVLIKVKNTVAQTDLSGAQRRKNLRGVFAVNGKADLSGACICVVDDIFTTGTTVAECSLSLKRNGVDHVDVLTFSRA